MRRGSRQRVLDGLIVALVVVVVALTGWVMTRDVQPSVSQAQETAGEPTLTADASTPASPDASPDASGGATAVASEGAEGSEESEAPTSEAPTSYAVIGDALSVAPGWPAVLAERTGMTLVADEAVRGAGYTDGQDRPTFLQQARALADEPQAPDLVVLLGSRSDSVATGAETRDAAAEVLDLLATELPDTRVVVVGPLWPSFAPPPGDGNAARQGVKTAARDAGLVHVDPQADPWIADADAGLLADDGVGLSQAGARLVAQRLQTALVDKGVLPAG